MLPWYSSLSLSDWIYVSHKAFINPSLAALALLQLEDFAEIQQHHKCANLEYQGVIFFCCNFCTKHQSLIDVIEWSRNWSLISEIVCCFSYWHIKISSKKTAKKYWYSHCHLWSTWCWMDVDGIHSHVRNNLSRPLLHCPGVHSFPTAQIPPD